MRPVANGIQNSDTPCFPISHRPMSFTTPLARIKEHERPASSSSEVAAPLQVPDHQSPDHPQWQTVCKEGKDLELRRQHCEQQQRDLGDDHKTDEHGESPAACHLRAKLDAQILGQCVSDDLADHERRLQFDLCPEQRKALVMGRGERLAERVHAEVRGEGRADGENNQGPRRRARQPACQSSALPDHYD
jgi:hypothetical protein